MMNFIKSILTFALAAIGTATLIAMTDHPGDSTCEYDEPDVCDIFEETGHHAPR